jgi:hypothetical protein
MFEEISGIFKIINMHKDKNEIVSDFLLNFSNCLHSYKNENLVVR